MPVSVEISAEASARGAVDKIAAARVWLLKEKPFFGVLARALVVQPSPALASAFRLHPDDALLVHPRAVLALPFPRLCARLSHLCLHAALGAAVRRRERTPARWNLAHDLAIEPLLREAALPAASGETPGWLRTGMSAEEVYDLLPEGASPAPEWCDLVDAPRPETEERAPPPGPPRGTAGEGEGEGAEPPADPTHDAAPHEVRARELAWKMRLAEALEVERASGGKTWGAMPSWIDALVTASIAPPPSWTLTLQRAVAALARSERSFLRPSRRQSAIAFDQGEDWPDVVSMPGRRIARAGSLVAVIDTSASISEAVLSAALGSIAAAATAEGVDEIRLLQADAEVTRDERVSPADLLVRPVAIKGRGGTRFEPALTLLAADAARASERFTVVYLTDLDGTFPDRRSVRGLDVLWVTTAIRPVPFGRVVRLT